MTPPREAQDQEPTIHFGTAGWRGIIGEDFTIGNVRRMCQALANLVVRHQGCQAQGVLIGYDRRFLSDRAARAAAEVFGGNNIPVFMLDEAAPTPLITYATAAQNAALGLAFTASHNPPEWNGLKVFHSDGSLLHTHETDAIGAEANSLSAGDVVKAEFDVALEAGLVRMTDYTSAYIDAIEAFVDLRAIRQARLRVIIDAMYGVGHLVLGPILVEARCRVTSIHTSHDPLFGGRAPTPEPAALSDLIRLVKEGNYDLGLAMDGDADRLTVVDEQGHFIHANDILLLTYYYLHEIKGQRGGVVRNISTTHLIDRLAARLGEHCYEVPVGFMHVARAMREHDCLLAGEGSGGLTIRGYIPGKDGVLTAMLLVDMVACTGQPISALREQVYALTGRLYTVIDNSPATDEMKATIPRRLAETSAESIGPYPVKSVSHVDGIRFLLENDNWLLIRFSGTEPVFRLCAEADTLEKAAELVAYAKQLTQLT
jgi:phosphomannomutase